jgi:hypothetical protein
MSVAFCVACGLTDGTVRLSRLEQPNDLSALVATVRVEPDGALNQEEAVLEVTTESSRRCLRGAGATLLYPEWEALRSDGRALATRNEADSGRIEQFIELLNAGRPDAVKLRAAFEAKR